MCLRVCNLPSSERWHMLYPARVKRGAEMSTVLINIPWLLYGRTDAVFEAGVLQADGEK